MTAEIKTIGEIVAERYGASFGHWTVTETERCVLAGFWAGGTTGNADVRTSVASLLREEMFEVEVHRAVYGVLRACWEDGHGWLGSDVAALTGALRASGRGDVVEGAESFWGSAAGGALGYYLSRPTEPSAALYCAKLVRDGWLRRKGAEELYAATAGLSNLGIPASEVIFGAARRLEELDTESEGDTYRGNLAALVSEVIEDIETGKMDEVVPTPVSALNDILAGGLRPGLTILAARPSMGKSSFALNVIAHEALAGSPVGVLDVDQTLKSFAHRILAHTSGIPMDHLRAIEGEDGQLRPVLQRHRWGELAAAMELLESIDLRLYGGQATLPAAKRLMGEVAGAGGRLVVIDGLWLFREIQEAPEDAKVAAYERVTSTLKRYAQNMDIALLLIHQLNRGVEQRNIKRPTMGDLRGSGSIEQDANVVLLLYRDDYYAEAEGRDSRDPGGAEVIVGKQKNGPRTTVRASVDLATFRFFDHTPGR